MVIERLWFYMVI